MQPEPTNTKDLAPVQALLAAAQLPWEDLTAAHLQHFLVLRTGAGEPFAAGGIELYGSDALLRSIVVAPSERGRGHAGRLVRRLEQGAAAKGVRRFYLLTTTAADFFTHLGYQPAERAGAPAAIQATREFQDLCPASATCMVKVLTGG